MFADPDREPPPLQPVCWSAEFNCCSEPLQHPGHTIERKNSSAVVSSQFLTNSAGKSGSNWTSAWCRFQAENKKGARAAKSHSREHPSSACRSALGRLTFHNLFHRCEQIRKICAKHYKIKYTTVFDYWTR